MNSFSFADFLKTPQGEVLHAWESSQYDEFSADAFGREALQVGAPQLDTLRANGIVSQWLASESYDELDDRLLRPVLQSVQAESGWLPFPAESFDLVTLPHALDFAPSAHQTLREAARVLQPEGRLILTVFNPLSLWWMRQKAVGAGLRPYLPDHMLPPCPSTASRTGSRSSDSKSTAGASASIPRAATASKASPVGSGSTRPETAGRRTAPTSSCFAPSSACPA